MTSAVLFDLDGTLIDSVPDLAEALSALLVEHGRDPLQAPAVRRMIGQGARVLIERAWGATGEPLEPDRLEPLYRRFVELYTPISAVRTRPYPEVVETLEGLSAAHPLAVVTNKPERQARIVLDALGLSRWFGAVVGGDTLEVRKPDPEPLRLALRQLGHAGPAVMVGDSTADVRAAAAAGLPCIAVTWGYADVPVEELGAQTLVGRFGEIPERLARLVG